MIRCTSNFLRNGWHEWLSPLLIIVKQANIASQLHHTNCFLHYLHFLDYILYSHHFTASFTDNKLKLCHFFVEYFVDLEGRKEQDPSLHWDFYSSSLFGKRPLNYSRIYDLNHLGYWLIKFCITLCKLGGRKKNDWKLLLLEQRAE